MDCNFDALCFCEDCFEIWLARGVYISVISSGVCWTVSAALAWISAKNDINGWNLGAGIFSVVTPSLAIIGYGYQQNKMITTVLFHPYTPHVVLLVYIIVGALVVVVHTYAGV